MFIFILVAIAAIGCFILLFASWEKSNRRSNAIKQHFKSVEVSASLTDKMSQRAAKFGKTKLAEMEQKFLDAGFYNTTFARYYMPGKTIVIILSLVVIAFTDMELKNKGITWMLCVIAVLIIPDMYLAGRKKKLISKTSHQLPYMIDMMAVCVQTGMTTEAALAYLSVELYAFDKDLCFHIKKTADEARVRGLENALLSFNKRLNCPEVRSFSLTLIQNIKYGSSISNVLIDLATDMREMQLLAMEEKIGKLAAKMSIPLILFIMLPIVILIVAPGFMQLEVRF